MNESVPQEKRKVNAVMQGSIPSQNCSIKKNNFVSLIKRGYTLTSPSADPVAKNSSFGSNAMHFTATEDSCAVNL